MSRASLAAAAFALAGGEPIDARSLVRVDVGPAGSARRLLIAVEPMEPTARGRELAALALATCDEVFAASRSLPAPTALLRALAAANRSLLAENRSGAAGYRERRVLLGATAIAVQGREATIAQVPPSQAIVVQDGQHYAFPDLASWRSDFIPETDDPEPDPLGCRDGGRPLLYRTLMAPGDLILLCSANIGRALARADDGTVAIVPDVDATLDAMARLVAEREFDDAFVAAIGFEEATRVRRRPPRPLGPPASAPSIPSPPPVSPPGPRPSPALAGTFATRATGGPAEERRRSSARGLPSGTGPALAGGVATFSPNVPDPFGALRLALVEIVEAVRPVRPLTRPTVVPGADRVQRFRGERALPSGLRASLPRGVMLPLRTGIGAAFLAGTVLLGGVTLAIEARRDDRMRVSTALAALDAAVAAAAADPLAAAARIAEADSAVATIDAGLLPSEWSQRSAALEAARDQAWAIERLRTPTRLGVLPASLRGGEARLIALGDRVFLAADGFYEIDLGTGQLVELLATGEAVADGALGRIVDGVSDGQGVALSDGTAIYQQGRDGRWSGMGLVPDDAGLRPEPGLTAGFNGHLYALAADGRIVRYDDDGQGLAPTTWAGPADYPDLADARDLAVNGRIHVLLNDGRVLALYEGVLEAANAVPVTPAMTGEGFFGESAGSQALYLVEPGFRAGAVSGRVIRFDAGGATQQFVAPAPQPGDRTMEAAAAALGRARAVAVLEQTGTIVFLSGDELWRAKLPPLVGV